MPRCAVRNTKIELRHAPLARGYRARMDTASNSSDEGKASEDPYCKVMLMILDPNVAFSKRVLATMHKVTVPVCFCSILQFHPFHVSFLFKIKTLLITLGTSSLIGYMVAKPQVGK